MYTLDTSGASGTKDIKDTDTHEHIFGHKYVHIHGTISYEVMKY
jgi:hypothetical protein